MRFMIHEKGQGLVEYALIFMLIAVIVIVLVYFLGPSVGNMYSQVVPGL
jgi:pilus assembly protein Flp/PilA